MKNFDFDELRKIVAIKHNVLLGENDPILVTVTLNELVLEKYLNILTEEYIQANKALAITLEQNIELSKDTAGKIITNAANYISDEVDKSVKSGVANAVLEMKQHLEESRKLNNLVAESEHFTKLARNGSFIAAILAGTAMIISILVLVIILVK